jgi:hypothetical protein
VAAFPWTGWQLSLEYADQNVINFVDHLKGLIKDEGFEHKYPLKNDNDKEWSCSSLADAKNSYSWEKHNFQETKIHLKGISDRLKKSFLDGDEKEALRSCVDILDWGGIPSGTHGIVKLYLDNNLINSIEKSLREMSNNDVCLDGFKPRTDGVQPFRMNSSFTKIYSLLSSSPFIIYDSRVSAALQLIAKKFWINIGEGKKLPDVLSFIALEGRAKKANRNATDKDKNIVFDTAQYKKEYNHAKWNVRANWIIERALEGVDVFAGETDKLDKMRAVEAALFMIGYHVD